jgi:hypothetical protein
MAGKRIAQLCQALPAPVLGSAKSDCGQPTAPTLARGLPHLLARPSRCGGLFFRPPRAAELFGDVASPSRPHLARRRQELRRASGWGLSPQPRVWCSLRREDALNKFTIPAGSSAPRRRPRQNRGQGHGLPRRGERVTRRLAVPGQRRQPRTRAHGQGHQVLQGRGPQLKDPDLRSPAASDQRRTLLASASRTSRCASSFSRKPSSIARSAALRTAST